MFDWLKRSVEFLTPFAPSIRLRDEVGASGVPPPDRPDHKVLIELVRLHARALKRLPIAQSLVIAGLDGVAAPYVPAATFLAWGLLTLTIECLRSIYAESILRRATAIDPRRVHRRFMVLAAIAGGAVGLFAVCFMPHLPLTHQALTAIVLFAMPSAGITVAVSSKYILAVYALGILIPTAGSWATSYPDQTLVVWGLTGVYWVFLITVAADGEKLLLDSVILRQQRDRMVVELEQINAGIVAARDRAEQSARSRAYMLAVASHDIGQPLHALSLYTAMLAANPPPDSLQEVSRNIARIVRSLGGLLNGLLDLSRLSAGQYQPEERIFSLNGIAFDVCTEYQAAADDKRINLVRELSPVHLRTDPVAVTRIIRNLLDNAIKYTDQGEVRVETHRDGPTAILVIADTGIGMPPAEHTRIFDEFYQLDNPGHECDKGVGLGLAIVQHLSELLAVRISLTSEPGRGTSWSLRFPCAISEPTVVDTTRAPPAAGSDRRAGISRY